MQPIINKQEGSPSLNNDNDKRWSLINNRHKEHTNNNNNTRGKPTAETHVNDQIRQVVSNTNMKQCT